MKRNLIRAALAVALLAPGLLAVWADEPAKPKDKPKEAEITDILKDVKDWNADKFVSPPTQFRPGHVNPRKLDANAVVKKGTGFEISLPSKAPIPTPTIYKGKLFVSGGFHSREFYCFDALTGKFLWGIDLDDDGPTAAVCADGVVVFNTESCTLFAVDAETGKHLWSYWLGDPLTSTPTIANGKVFTSYPAAGRGQQMQQNNAPKPADPKKDDGKARANPPCSHVLAAFDLKTGKILWQRWIDSDVMSAPVAVDKELYASSFAGVVYKFNQETGEVLSARKSRATSAPVVVGDNVYLTRRADDGKGGKVQESIAAQSRGTGKPMFEVNKKDAIYLDGKAQDRTSLKSEGQKLDAGNGFGGGAPAAANPDAAYRNIGQSNVCTMQAFQGSRVIHLGGRNINCMGDEVVCTDPKTGKNLWTVKLKGDLQKEGGFLAAPPASAAGHLFVVTLGGEILQMSPEKGETVKTYKVGAPVRFQPAIDGGRLYVGTQDGKVICIDTGDAKITGWPCWGGNPAHTGLPVELKK